MAELHVRNSPPDVYAGLRRRAKTEGRSMSVGAAAILRAASQSARSRAGRNDVIERLCAIRQRAHIGADTPPAEDLIWENRQRSA